MDSAAEGTAGGRRTALVTGAARGIGAAVVRRLAAEGMRVICVDRGSDDPRLGYPLGTVAELQEVARAAGGGAEAIVADVADRDALADALAGVGALDVVVCAAGAVWGGPPVWETPPEKWRAMFEVNVDGVMHVLAVTVPKLLERDRPRSGRFVAVASAAGGRGLPRMGAYAAAKHAVVGLVRSLAADLGDSGITANAVAPGSTRTAGLRASAEVYDLGDVEDFADHHLSGRLLEPEEVADAVAWLCSSGASGVTGSVLAVDGGMTAT